MSCTEGAFEPPAARSNCAWRKDDAAATGAVGVVELAAGAVGAAVAQAASSSKALIEAMNRMRANVPPPAPARNACQALPARLNAPAKG